MKMSKFIILAINEENKIFKELNIGNSGKIV